MALNPAKLNDCQFFSASRYFCATSYSRHTILATLADRAAD
jgi:hypothetical protein